MDIEKWENGGYSVELMGMVVAWYRGNQSFRSHMEDAKQPKPKGK